MKDEDLINHQLRMLAYIKNERQKLMQLQKLVYRVDSFIEHLKINEKQKTACRLLIECSSALHFLITRYQLPTEEVRSDACKIKEATEVHGTGARLSESGEENQDWHEPDSA